MKQQHSIQLFTFCVSFLSVWFLNECINTDEPLSPETICTNTLPLIDKNHNSFINAIICYWIRAWSVGNYIQLRSDWYEEMSLSCSNVNIVGGRLADWNSLDRYISRSVLHISIDGWLRKQKCEQFIKDNVILNSILIYYSIRKFISNKYNTICRTFSFPIPVSQINVMLHFQVNI